MMKPWVACTILEIVICVYFFMPPSLFIIIFKVYSCWVVISYMSKVGGISF